MRFAVLVGLAFDIPRTDAVGIDSGSFSLPGSRYFGARGPGRTGHAPLWFFFLSRRPHPFARYRVDPSC